MRHVLLALLLTAPACGSDVGSATDGGVDGHGALPDLRVLDLGPPRGTINPSGQGGSANLLAFGAFGDIRPPIPDDDFQYPSAVAKSIFDQMAMTDAEFAVGTGDYMFVEYLSFSANDQIKKLKAAEAGFTRPIFHALGNHECNSFTDVNCPKLNESVNITAFLKQLVPFTPVPWFSFVVHTALGDAKFLFIAVNAWNADQAAWLTQAVAQPTKYTFVVRHHPTPDAGKAANAEGIKASDAILAGHPVTLFLFGHVHEYQHLTTNAVISGNAGAPLDTGKYGWVYVVQRNDGTIAVSEYDQGTGMPTDTWAVTADGQMAK